MIDTADWSVSRQFIENVEYVLNGRKLDYLIAVSYTHLKGIPNITAEQFEWKFTTDNQSMMPAIINTLLITATALIAAVPFGIGSAVYLVEYAKRGSRLVGLIRLCLLYTSKKSPVCNRIRVVNEIKIYK